MQLLTHDALPALLADLASDESQNTIVHVQGVSSGHGVSLPLEWRFLLELPGGVGLL